MTFGVIGATIRLRSGCYLDLLDPQPWQFTLRDIAGGLSKICRFGGQIDKFYSVAEHSVNCASQAIQDGHDAQTCRAVLLHDAAEAFVGDVVKPLKALLGNSYRDVEKRVEAAIYRKYCKWPISSETQGIITDIDHSMLIAERNALFGRDGHEWTGERELRRLLSIKPYCWLPDVAEAKFMVAVFDLNTIGHCKTDDDGAEFSGGDA